MARPPNFIHPRSKRLSILARAQTRLETDSFCRFAWTLSIETRHARLPNLPKRLLTPFRVQSNAATPANFKNRISNHINLFQRAIKEGNNDEVLKQFDLLPGSHKFKKFVQLARLKSAAAVDTELYLAAMKDYLNRFEDDPSVLTLGMGYYFRIEELDKAQDSVRQLADLVGEDAMIKSLRSDLLFRQGKLDESIKEATAGMELEPEFEDNYQSRLIVACHTKNNELILATLKAIAQNLGLSDSKLADIPDFKEFCASPQYQEWLQFVEDSGNH